MMWMKTEDSDVELHDTNVCHPTNSNSFGLVVAKHLTDEVWYMHI
jgi:hypothetical protein